MMHFYSNIYIISISRWNFSLSHKWFIFQKIWPLGDNRIIKFININSEWQHFHIICQHVNQVFILTAYHKCDCPGQAIPPILFCHWIGLANHARKSAEHGFKSFWLSHAHAKTPWKGFTNDQSKQPFTGPYTGKVGVISKKINKI